MSQSEKLIPVVGVELSLTVPPKRHIVKGCTLDAEIVSRPRKGKPLKCKVVPTETLGRKRHWRGRAMGSLWQFHAATGRPRWWYAKFQVEEVSP